MQTLKILEVIRLMFGQCPNGTLPIQLDGAAPDLLDFTWCMIKQEGGKYFVSRSSEPGIPTWKEISDNILAKHVVTFSGYSNLSNSNITLCYHGVDDGADGWAMPQKIKAAA